MDSKKINEIFDKALAGDKDFMKDLEEYQVEEEKLDLNSRDDEVIIE